MTTLKQYVLGIISRVSGLLPDVCRLIDDYFFDGETIGIFPLTYHGKYVENFNVDAEQLLRSGLMYAVYHAWESKRYDCVIGLLGTRLLDNYPQYRPDGSEFYKWDRWTKKYVTPAPKNASRSSEFSYFYSIGRRTMDDSAIMPQWLILPRWAYPKVGD